MNRDIYKYTHARIIKSMTFFELVKNSGTFGIAVWCVIFMFWPVGVIAGLTAVVRTSFRKTKDSIPFSYKFLFILAAGNL